MNLTPLLYSAIRTSTISITASTAETSDSHTTYKAAKAALTAARSRMNWIRSKTTLHKCPITSIKCLKKEMSPCI